MLATIPPLYPVVDVDFCRARGLDPLTLLAAVLDGGGRFIQLRDKNPSSGARLRLADAAVTLARAAGARLIVNDRPDIARMSGADGVHVGQEDLPVAEARQVVGSGAIVGVSTHDPAQLDAALRTDADYLAVGPIYGTSTKDTGYTARGLGLVREAVLRTRAGQALRRRSGQALRLRSGQADEARVPVVAIGGITLARAPEVMAAGADSVAVISDLLTGGDPAARVRAFLDGLSERRV